MQQQQQQRGRRDRRRQHRRFDLHKLRPSGFRFFICCLEVTNLTNGRLQPRGAVAPAARGGGGGGGFDSSPEDPGPMPGPMMQLDVAEGGDAGAAGVGKAGSGALPSYVVVNMDLLGLEALWSVALEVEEEVSEAAIKKLCEVCGMRVFK